MFNKKELFMIISATPAAILFGIAVWLITYQWLEFAPSMVAIPLALLVSLAGVVGFEGAGILASHMLFKHITNGLYLGIAIGLIGVLVYGVAGWYMLAEFPTAIRAFLFLTISVYILVGSDAALTAVSESESESKERRRLERLEDRRTKATREHEMKMSKVKVKAEPAQKSKVKGQKVKMKSKRKTTAKYKKVVAELRLDSGQSNAAIGRKIGSTGQYVGQVRKDLNGELS